MYVLDRNGIELNAECLVGEEDGVYGLILESWGPAHRNKDYNVALDYIIERLIYSGIDKVTVYLASLPARRFMPFIAERKIHPDEYFPLIGNSPSDIRQKMCRYQANFSSTGKKTAPSGNRTKRIMISVPGVNSADFWDSIIYGDTSTLFEPTDDESVLSERVSRLIKLPLKEPEGYKIPSTVERVKRVYVRDPAVKAWVLRQSKGYCERCGEYAPFSIKSDSPYLEVHHVIPLSLSGADTVSNCVALCPNCHRALHYSENSEELIEMLYIKIKRLQR
ncbi:Predicted restriction endonuclease [Serratia marcescens]|uniref:HNH endonuclease n=1 Tax=Serratia TaxID=613 RepID=UPI0007452EC1|nr:MULTISPECIES: HNH endonuclease signature motif containing protein [Serratia]MBH3004104.1 HNH endonuclease [Serratia marcescens]MDP8753864.1 HNH endonuclease signature motif containing protein [Serratia marcescens]MDP8758525.1 HNH endonuclease signature motif containing protein [Serratia marcescens]MDP8768266.1 HNH endonuclease signature motif containing protein [Serratia marcescens]MDP8878370.1 HNH endonuclease signature motif containing protein [Serratia marcescens]